MTEISFEFFPPQSPEGLDKLRHLALQLAALQPAFYSVTYGAGGSTQERTFAAVSELLAAGLPAAPHLSCIGATRQSIAAILQRYQAAGIRRIVALRGDLPSGMMDPGDFRYACELVEFIRRENGDWFHIDVACYPEWHPQAKSPRDDLLALKRKVEAGATGAITQFFFNGDAYRHFVSEARALGIGIPIVPGIMPIGNYAKLARFADGCGAEIPRWMRKKFESLAGDDAAQRRFGLDVVSQLCAQLLAAGAPGLHFYTLNQAEPLLELLQRIAVNR